MLLPYKYTDSNNNNINFWKTCQSILFLHWSVKINSLTWILVKCFLNYWSLIEFLVNSKEQNVFQQSIIKVCLLFIHKDIEM